MRASICIFRNTLDYKDDRAVPVVPEEVLEAAQRVIESKSTEMIKNNNGMYFVEYAEDGPFDSYVDSNQWMPVKVYRLDSWRAGGVRVEEMANFNKKDAPESEETEAPQEGERTKKEDQLNDYTN